MPATSLYGTHDALVAVGVMEITPTGVEVVSLDDYEEIPSAIVINPPPEPIGQIDSVQWMATSPSGGTVQEAKVG